MAFLKSKLGCMSALLLAGLFAAGSTANAQVTLRYKFKEGEKLNYELEQKMNMAMTVNGQNIRMEMVNTMDMSWNIHSVDKDGKAKMTQKFGRVRLSMDGLPGMGKIEFDSKDGKEIEGPFGQILGPILKALAGAEFDVTMDAQGKVTDFKIPPGLAETFKKLPQGAGTADMFSEEGLKHMVGQGSLVLPAEAVTKGKSWEQKFEMKMQASKMKVVNQLSYDGPATVGGKKFEKIDMKPKLTMEADDSAPVKMKLKDQDTKGEAYFDNEAGRLDNLAMTQDMDMEMEVNGMAFKQKIEQKVTMKLVDKSK